jgi:hypothetical protein
MQARLAPELWGMHVGGDKVDYSSKELISRACCFLMVTAIPRKFHLLNPTRFQYGGKKLQTQHRIVCQVWEGLWAVISVY